MAHHPIPHSINPFGPRHEYFEQKLDTWLPLLPILPSVRICTPNGKSHEATISQGGDPITFDDLPLSSLLDLNSLSNRNYKLVSSFVWLVIITVMGKLVSETVLRDALLPSRQVQGLFSFEKVLRPEIEIWNLMNLIRQITGLGEKVLDYLAELEHEDWNDLSPL